MLQIHSVIESRFNQIFYSLACAIIVFHNCIWDKIFSTGKPKITRPPKMSIKHTCTEQQLKNSAKVKVGLPNINVSWGRDTRATFPFCPSGQPLPGQSPIGLKTCYWSFLLKINLRFSASNVILRKYPKRILWTFIYFHNYCPCTLL